MITLNNIPVSFLYDVPKDVDHKNIILDLIQKIPPNKYKEISHTDVNLPEGFHREYTFYFLKNIYPQFKQKFLEHLGETRMDLQNIWFQWYNQNDYHAWHVHPWCHFTNIYYLKNTNINLNTQIKFGKKDYEVEIKEGQILTIPSFYLHQSPINTLKEPKVVISFNTTLKGNE
jgi:hypothetical protein|tara:strand:- start:373 stop:891 length:519 start_codon:yes stop_codon:yes gene_type:complete